MKKIFFLSIIMIGRMFAEGEFLLDTSVVYIPASLMQHSPSSVFDGINWLVVWEDQRAGGIYGTRVTQAGEVIDPLGIRIVADNMGTSWNRTPSVAFDGVNYLVVWEDYHSYNSHIKGARVSQQGTVIDYSPLPISISPEPPNPSEWKWAPATSFDGTNYLVVWVDYTQGYYFIKCARITPSGGILDPYGINISSSGIDEDVPSVAFDGTNYLVVWQDKRNGNFDIYGARVTPSGAVLDPNGIPINVNSGNQCNPAISFDGINFFIVWRDSSVNFNITGARVTPMGVVLDTTGIIIANSDTMLLPPQVTYDGTNYLVSWRWRPSLISEGIYGARVTPGGIVLDTLGILIYEDSYLSSPRLTLTFGDSTYLIAWEGRNFLETVNYTDVYAVRVTRSAGLIDTEKVCLSTTIKNTEISPSISYDGENYFVVWTNYIYPVAPADNAGCLLKATRVTSNGLILDPGGIAFGKLGCEPSICFGAPYYFVAWMHAYPDYGRDIYGARISTNGIVLDSIQISHNPGRYQLNPDVAFDGTNYLVVWAYDYTGIFDIYGKRINQDGVVIDSSPGIVISNAYHDQGNPAVAFDGTNYFVVWDDFRNIGTTSQDIYGARVTPGGIVLDPNGIAVSLAPNSQNTPALAFDGANYLVVWCDLRNGNRDIYGARVSPGGTVVDPQGIPICTAVGNQFSPTVDFDGVNYIVVWVDTSNGNKDIYGAKVNPEGVVLDTFVVSSQSGDQCYPSLAHGTGDSLLITYSGWVDFIGGKPVNTYRIWGKFYPLIGIEEERGLIGAETSEGLRVYPNPFTNAVRIEYCGNWNMDDVNLKIYDASGRLVKSFQPLPANSLPWQIVWNGRADSKDNVPAGVYFCKLELDKKKRLIKKIVKLK